MSDSIPTLADLVAMLAADAAIAQLGAALTPQARLHVAQVPASARRATAAALWQRLERPLLLVAPTPDAAARIHHDLGCFVGAAALLFPATDGLPYEHMSPDVSIVAARIQVLQQLQQPGPWLVTTSVRAMLQPTLTPAELTHAMRPLHQNDRVDPRMLLEHWISLGYRRTPTAEQPGEVSLRGGILDIFPPASERPVRLEFWDDTLESLRLYDPLSQRSLQRIRSITIGPPHEIPLWRRTEALDHIAALDLSALRPEVAQEWTTAREHLELDEPFEGRAFYAPFFRTSQDSRAAALTRHMPADTLVLFSEFREVNDAASDLDAQVAQAREAQIAAAELPAAYPAPLLSWAALQELLTAYPCADLSNQPPDAELVSSFGTPFELDLFTAPTSFGGQLERWLDGMQDQLVGGQRIVVVSPQSARLRELSREKHLALLGAEDGPAAAGTVAAGTIAIRHGALSGGWAAPRLKLQLLTDGEVFGWRPRRAISTRARRERSEAERATFLQSLKPGDYVVHIEHGIARYDGLTRLTAGTSEREFMQLSYASGDRLYVPIDQVDRVSRYVGAGENGRPALTRLGTSEWERAKRKVRESIEELATELLELYALRQSVSGHAYSEDTTWQHELEDSFPFTETDDQLRALAEVKQDMEGERPMDRLICGDVGYGKTEVALRAAFKAVQDGFQVAVLVPTTILAQQHFETFNRRMQPFPVRVEMLSRFRTSAQQKTILEKLARGEIDLIIGTHRLLSQDVAFHNLGLVIIDEEQRFGVRHKERLKQLRQQVDVLTLTATPIPRTMHMALAGIRDLSVIDTPPDDRIPIKTYVQPYSEPLVRDALLRELGRGGQAYVVHNRVHSIYAVANRLQQLVPEARIGVGHGQMPEKALEKVMLQFFDGAFDVLVCTTIIESGLDVPSANTIIIDDATNYGLAQLYQLRGRIGRSTVRGYAYLFYNPTRAMTEEATQRLEAIQEATQLGAGFRIAMRDLEIRGTGNLLGAEQSGNIAAIGFDLYSRLLAQAVERLRDESAAGSRRSQREGRQQRQQSVEALRRAAVLGTNHSISSSDAPVLPEAMVSIDLPINAYLPDEYVADATLRLRVYQHIAEARTTQDLRMLRQELVDRFGPLPEPAERLLDLLHIKVLALAAGVASIIADEQTITLRLPAGSAFDRDRLRRTVPNGVSIGNDLARLDRRALGAGWEAALHTLLELLTPR